MYMRQLKQPTWASTTVRTTNDMFKHIEDLNTQDESDSTILFCSSHATPMNKEDWNTNSIEVQSQNTNADEATETTNMRKHNGASDAC